MFVPKHRSLQNTHEEPFGDICPTHLRAVDDCAKSEIAYSAYGPVRGPGTISNLEPVHMQNTLSHIWHSRQRNREVLDKYHITALHAYFAGNGDLVQTKCTIVTALLRAFHPCIAHPRAISSTPGSRSDVYKCTNSREWTQTSD